MPIFSRCETELVFYSFCPDFKIKPNEELILVSNDGLWGYINKSNSLVIDCIYEKARPFSEGMAAVYHHFIGDL